MNGETLSHQSRIDSAFENSRAVGILLTLGRWLAWSAANNSWLRMERRLGTWLNGSRVFSPEMIRNRPLEPRWSCVLRASLIYRAVWRIIERLWMIGCRVFDLTLGRVRPMPVLSSSRSLSWLVAGMKDPGLSVPAVALVLPLVSTRISLALILLAILGMLLTSKNDGSLSRTLRSPFDFSIFFFIVILTAAAVLSLTPRGSLITWASYLLYITFFYLIAARLDADGLRRVVGAFLLSTALLSLYGIFQYLIGVPAERAWVDQTVFSDLRTRVYSTLDNPNVLAEYLILSLPLSLAVCISARPWKERLFSAVVLGLGGVCLLLTMSRGGWVGFLFALVIFVTLRERRALLLLLMALVMAGFLLPEAFLGRAASIVNLQESSNSYRLSIWLAVSRMVGDFWVSGIGPGLASFNQVYPHYSLAAGKAFHAHNLFLQVLVEMGVLGLLSLLMLLWEFFRTGVRGLIIPGGYADSAYHRNLIAALMAGTGGFLLQGLTEHLWYSPRITIFFWMTLGLMAAAARIRTMSEAASERRYPEVC